MMSQECFEVLVGLSAVFTAQARNPVRIVSVDGGDFNARNRTRCTRVSICDVPPADETDVNRHGTHFRPHDSRTLSRRSQRPLCIELLLAHMSDSTDKCRTP